MAHKIKYHKTQWQFYVFKKVENKPILVKKLNTELEAINFCEKNEDFWYEKVH